MKKRLITGAILVGVFTPLIMIDHDKYPIVGVLFLILGVFLSIVASIEMMNMFETKYPTIRTLKYIIPIFSGLIVFIINVFTDDTFPKEILLLLLVILLIMLVTVLIKETTAMDIMSSIMTIIYCGLMFGYVINIRYLEPFDPGTSLIYLRGGRSFGYLISIVMGTDSFAYLFGVKFGKRKLAPDISPKKSVEGAIAGLIGGSLIGVAAIFLLGISQHTTPKEMVLVIVVGLVLSLFLSFMVQVGDLVASKFKRTYQIKDFGKILPGHGGVIDRFDSLLYAGVAYYLIVQALYLIV